MSFNQVLLLPLSQSPLQPRWILAQIRDRMNHDAPGLDLIKDPVNVAWHECPSETEHAQR